MIRTDPLGGRRWEVREGDVLGVLRGLPDGCVDCCVTSPSYFGLRDYGTGTWSGGDPDCDHIADVRFRDSSTIRDTSRIPEEQRGKGTPYRDVCGKCGAVREDAQIGLEKELDCLAWARGEAPCGECYVCRLRTVFAEVRRVLKPTGVAFIVLGDAYVSHKPRVGSIHSHSEGFPNQSAAFSAAQRAPDMRRQHGIVKDKDLCMVPARVALALQADGWWLRKMVVWAKGWSFSPDDPGNPMPESKTDAPVSAHEEVLILTKRARYWWDAFAVREQASGPPHPPGNLTVTQPEEKGHRDPAYEPDRVWGGTGRNLRDVWRINPGTRPPWAYCDACGQLFVGPERKAIRVERVIGEDGTEKPIRWCPCGRSDAWTSHYASFPLALPTVCIRAAAPERCCAVCGEPWRRVTQKPENPAGIMGKGRSRHVEDSHDLSGGRHVDPPHILDLGFRPACSCGEDAPIVPGLVLDPFSGSGTTLLAAMLEGRRALGIDLSAPYCRAARARLADCEARPDAYWKSLKALDKPEEKVHNEQPSLPLE